jgi:hypothetical protein
MESELRCEICGDSLVPNNIGRLVKKASEEEYVKLCKGCKKPKGKIQKKRGRGRPPSEVVFQGLIFLNPRAVILSF